MKLDGKKIEKKYVDEIIDTLGIRTKLENLPSALSGGQQQRVAIARALAAKPAILLADEPTGNLDSKTSQDVLGLLKVTSKRFHQTIVMITHNEEIAQMADRILQIEDGKIVSDIDVHAASLSEINEKMSLIYDNINVTECTDTKGNVHRIVLAL